jgi:hypothetical protein
MRLRKAATPFCAGIGWYTSSVGEPVVDCVSWWHAMFGVPQVCTIQVTGSVSLTIWVVLCGLRVRAMRTQAV